MRLLGSLNMPRVFLGNFAFEAELTDPSKSAGVPLLRRTSELAHLWMAIAEECDLLPLPYALEPELLRALADAGLPMPRFIDDLRDAPKTAEFTPWGWSETAVAAAKQARLPMRPPPLDVVRRVNSRCFSLKLEEEWNCGLPGARIVESVEAFREAVAGNPLESKRWIAKAEFGMAGRERVMGQGDTPPEAAINWAAKRFKQNLAIAFEPCVSIVAEAGLQFDIRRTGPPQMVGITPFLSAKTGQFRGCRFDDDDAILDDWDEAAAIGRRAAERIQSLGYFGPLGIDAAKYRDADGKIHVRPLQDINARFTMGRLALGFRRLLQTGESAVWLHQSWAGDSPGNALRDFVASLSKDVRVVRTSPFVSGEAPVSYGTLICIADDASRLGDVMSF